MKNEVNKEFTIVVRGNFVKGEIIHREMNAIRIKITEPYINWENSLYRSGPGVQNPRHFLTPHGDDVAVRLLKESYSKLEIIDESIHRICKVYGHYKKEISAIKSLEKGLIEANVKERILMKIEDWFFRDFLFTSSVTGLIATIGEKEKVIEILETYIKEKRKIYVQ